MVALERINFRETVARKNTKLNFFSMYFVRNNEKYICLLKIADTSFKNLKLLKKSSQQSVSSNITSFLIEAINKIPCDCGIKTIWPKWGCPPNWVSSPQMNNPWMSVNMPEHGWILINVPEYAWKCLNKLFWLFQSS